MQSQIIEFNQKYQKYSGRGKNIIGKDSEGNDIYDVLTYQDVASLINLANNDNKNRNFPIQTDPDFKIEICMGERTNVINDRELLTWMNTEVNRKPSVTYNCEEVHIDPTTTLVDYVRLSIHT